MPITPTPKIWMNGELVDWDKAQVHVLTHTLHYGTGVFEGIRAYETSQGPAVFRLTEHIQRLFNSAKIVGFEIPYTVDEIIELPLDILFDPANFGQHEIRRGEIRFSTPHVAYRNHQIWGATCLMIGELIGILEELP